MENIIKQIKTETANLANSKEWGDRKQAMVHATNLRALKKVLRHFP